MRRLYRDRPALLFAAVAGALLPVGLVVFGIAGGVRGAVSFLAGMAIATAVASFGALMIEVAGRISPSLAMVAALSNYLITVLLFVAVLRSVGPDVADVPAFATGLVTAVVPYLAWQFAKARPNR